MSITHQVTNSWGVGSILIGGLPIFLTGDNEQNSQSALGIVTNQAVPLVFAEAKLKSIYILADQNCTLKFNNSTTPTDTINLTAGVPFTWNSQSGVPYPFTGTAGAITALYVTTTQATNFNLRTLTVD